MRKLYVVLLVSLLASACGGEPPRFLWVRGPADTCDTLGPYRVEVEVFAPDGVYALSALLETPSGFTSSLHFEAVQEQRTGGLWALELGGLPAGARVGYYLKLVNGLRTGGGEIVLYPDGAPVELLEFAVLAAEACGGGD